MEHDHDAFRYGPDEVAWFQRFTLEPVAPETLRERAAAGDLLVTTDVPDYLERQLAPDIDTGPALYRLVQLFGTPNVPGLEAGVDQPDREMTTWQYLFRVTYTPDDGAEDEPPVPAPSEETEYLLSVYDYRTNLSVGLSRWRERGGRGNSGSGDPGGDAGNTDDGGRRRIAAEPGADPLPGGDLPDEEFLVALVQLVLSAVEHPVAATYEDLWI